MKVVKTSPGCNLFLGHQGEKLALQIVFDIAPWLETYGFGTAHLLHQRKGDAEPYPVATTQEGNEVQWDVSNSDTAVEGAGRYELHFYTGETLVKSVTGDTLTAGALQYGVAPPEPVQLWLDHVAEKEHELFQAVDQSTAAAQTAKDSATAAAQSEAKAAEAQAAADSSAKAAALSEKFANSAVDKTSASEANARNAEEQAQKAAGRAELAAANAESRETSANNASARARQAAAEASNDADLAEAAKTSAQNAADEAATHANRAESAADRAEEAAKNAGTGSGGSGIEVTAKPGQLIRVKETDENGKPTAWEAVPWGYTEGGMVEILPETTFTEENMREVFAALPPLGLVLGDTYIVKMNGTEIPIVAGVQDMGVTVSAVSLLDPNGMWVIVDVPPELVAQLGFNVIVKGDLAFPTTFSIYQNAEVVHPIPGELLPEGVPYVYKGYLLEETDAVETTDPNYGKVWVITKAPNLTAGETYTVMYNGTSYECVCIDLSTQGVTDGSVALGNLSVSGGENTGEPFAMIANHDKQMVIAMDLTGATSVRIGFMGKVGHKMDDRCIPDSTRVLVVKFAEREDGNLVSLTHTYRQMRTAINEGVPVIGLVKYSDGHWGSTALFGCYVGDSWIKGSDDEEYWRRGWEYSKYYLDGNISNETIGNELWLKNLTV